jgi:transglutaminase-like putative cysteine protease
MKSLIFFSLVFFSVLSLSAQDYNVLLIPDSLKENANVVDRYSEMHYTIINEKKAKLYEKEVFTILNDAGAKYADYVTRYDKFTSINDISGALYNAQGKRMKEVKNRDISDHAAYDGFSLMSDARYKEHNFYYNDYPYTVEYEETDDISQLFAMETWDPQISELMGVQYSKLVVETPVGFKFRYKQFNLAAPPQVTQTKNSVVYSWEVKNLHTKEKELFQPSWREIMPSVMLAPSAFGVGDYQGNMDTWQGYGNFVNELRKGRDVLPDNIKSIVHQLTDTVSNEYSKIKILYNYLQQNSRYVSVQLGVGGWQPFDANYVATNKYGDCKALSNYMIALLKEASIKAYYVEIRAGENEEPMQTDFPMFQSNHATVCVLVGKDSIWLECTSQTAPVGYAGTFTGNRNAILDDENGAHIVATPKYTSKENTVVRNVQARIDSAGNLLADVKTIYTGCETDELSSELEELSKDEFDHMLKREFSIPTYDISDYKTTQTKEIIPSINEDFELTAPGYSSVTGKRIFLKPNIFIYNSSKIDTSKPRQYDIELDNSFKHVDSVTINILSNYTVESLPKDIVMNTPYGNYSMSFKVNNNKIYCVRSFEQNSARFPSSEFKKFADFLNSIYKADRSQVVLIKQTN